MNISRPFLSLQNRKMLYYSLIHPHLLYGNLLWGFARKVHLHKLIVLQKKAIRIICDAKYNAHTPPLYSKLLIPKLEYMYSIQLCQFIFLHMRHLLPQPINSIFRINASVYNTNTRQRLDIHQFPITCDTVFRSFIRKGPEIWASLPEHIKDAVSVKSFGSQIKKHFISLYT